MKHVLLIASLGVLAGCAMDSQKLAVCDGKHRRPANPYGTVLPGAPTTPEASPAKAVGTPGGGCGRSR